MKKKKMLALLIVCVMLLVFGVSGCGEQTSSQPKSQRDRKLVELDLESYRQYLEVHDITIDDLMVNGYIKNNGDKEIMVIEYKIYYLDKGDKPVGESSGLTMYKDAHKNYSSIKPNYDCKFTDIVPESVLKSWDHKVEVEITSIKMEE